MKDFLTKRARFIDSLTNPLLITIVILLAIDHWAHLSVRDLAMFAILIGLGLWNGRP